MAANSYIDEDMQVKKDIIIEGSNKRPIGIDIFNPETENSPLVIFAHGFKGFKDWGHFDLIAKTFAKNGIAFIKFNFSHNGVTPENPEEFTDLEAFGNNNFSIEQEDLGYVMDWVENTAHIWGYDLSKCYLLGHSRGGAAVLLKAANDQRVKGVITWASIAKYGRYWSDELMRDWQENGVQYVINGRTGQRLPMYWQMYEDFFANKDKLDIPAAVKSLNIPQLIIHGTDDPAVDHKGALELKDWNSSAELITLEGAGHTFGGKHPWTDDNLADDMQKAVDATINFIR